MCVEESVSGGMKFRGDKLFMNIDSPEDWEHLIELCPSGALAMDSREYSVKEVMEEIRKDMVFYRHDGGVTLSG